MLFPERRRRRKGLADLLVYGALVGPGIVINKDGSLLAGWDYRGPDLTSATPEDLAAVAAQVNRALLPLGDGWMIHTDATRVPAEDYPALGAFPDPVTSLIDEERRRQFQTAGRNFTTIFSLFVTFLAPPAGKTRLAQLLFEGASSKRERSEDALAAFGHRLQEIEDVLGSVLDLRRMDSQRLLSHLSAALTGLNHPVCVPPIPCYLDTVLASVDLVGGFEPCLGDRHLAAISLLGFPASTTTGILEALQNLPFEYRWSNRFIPLDPATAALHVRRFRAHWFRSRRGLSDILRHALIPAGPGGEDSNAFADRHALSMAEDADIALGEATSGAVRFGYYSSTVLLTETDRSALSENCRVILRTLRNAGFPAQAESVNAVEAFLGSLPGHGTQNIRRPLVHTLNLAHLVPTTAVYAGSAVNPSPLFPPGSPALLWAATGGSTPFRLSLHAGSDVGHTLVVGPTGAGKSALITLLEAQWFRYPDAQVFVFDKGGSSLPLVLAAGGHHYDIASDSSAFGFYPLQHIDDLAERAWAAEWIETLVVGQGIAVTSHQRSLIQRALELLATFPERTFTAFSSKLQDIELRSALQPYTYQGLFGPLFDASSDPLKTSRFTCFEMAHLLEFYPRAVNLILLYLFHRIEQRLDGRPTLIVLEEAWTFLDTPLFADRIQSWLRELRKKNAVVVFVTQSLADLHNSPLRDVIYSSSPTKILLPNSEAVSEAGFQYYRALGINAQEALLLATATPKRHYYFTSPQGRRLIDLTLGPVALSFLGATSREDLRTVTELAGSEGSSWPCTWLRRRNLPAQAERLAGLSKELLP